MLRQVTTFSVVSFEELNHLVTFYDKQGVPRSYSDPRETNFKERRTVSSAQQVLLFANLQ